MIARLYGAAWQTSPRTPDPGYLPMSDVGEGVTVPSDSHSAHRGPDGLVRRVWAETVHTWGREDCRDT